MPDQSTYLLKGHGTLEPGWVSTCFALFKERGINIRKLVLVRNAAPQLDTLEIQFVLRESDREAFLQSLERQLDSLAWQDKTLSLL